MSRLKALLHISLVVVLVSVCSLSLFTGCAVTPVPLSRQGATEIGSSAIPTTESVAIPTGNELYAQGKANFLAFLEQVSALQMTLEPGQWRVSGYGDYPSRCITTDDQDGYFYALERSVIHQGHDINAIADGVEEYLVGVGYEVERREHNPTMRGVMAWGIGPVFQIYYISDDNGSMSVTTQSNCFPGNAIELAKIQTDEYKAVMPPLRETVSPTDPVQYGQELPVQP